jgi:tRNA dimethylallyltransferase
MPENRNNKRYLVRTLERAGHVGHVSSIPDNVLILGLREDPEVLRQRINIRISQMVAQGLVQEAELLLSRYPADTQALQAPGYKALAEYIAGSLELPAALDKFAQADYQLAKRQLTWFKRNKSIHWLDNRDKLANGVDIVTTFMLV